MKYKWNNLTIEQEEEFIKNIIARYTHLMNYANNPSIKPDYRDNCRKNAERITQILDVLNVQEGRTKMSNLEECIQTELRKISPFKFNPQEMQVIKDGIKKWLVQENIGLAEERTRATINWVFQRILKDIDKINLTI